MSPPARPAVVPDPPAAIEPAALAVDLRWNAPEACPAHASVVADLEALTDLRVDPTASDVVIIEAAIVRHGAGYVLRLSERRGSDPPSTRELNDVDCDVLARAAALMVAVSVAPVATAAAVRSGLELRAATPDDTPATPPDTERVIDDAPRSAAPVDRPRPRETAPTSRPRTPWTQRFLASARVGPAIGLVPGPTAAVGGALGWGFGPLRVEAVGTHAIRRTDAVTDGAAIRASSTGGGLHLSYAPVIGAFVPLFGAGFEAGIVAGQGTGTRVDSRPVRAPFTAVALVLGLSWPAEGRIALRAAAEALVHTRRPGFHLGAAAAEPIPAFRVPAAGLRVMIGPELRLP